MSTSFPVSGESCFQTFSRMIRRSVTEKFQAGQRFLRIGQQDPAGEQRDRRALRGQVSFKQAPVLGHVGEFHTAGQIRVSAELGQEMFFSEAFRFDVRRDRIGIVAAAGGQRYLADHFTGIVIDPVG